MTSINQLSFTSLPKQSVEMIQNYPQQFEQILGEFNVKSKKRRIRKKMLKMAVEQLANRQQMQEIPVVVVPAPTKKSEAKVVQMTEKVAEVQIPKAVDVTETFDFSKLPIGFVLKVGKQFFSNEQVFRFYYNQNHPEIYKNKPLLMERFAALVTEAEGDVRESITPLLTEQLAN